MRLPAENIKAAREVQLVDFLNTYRPGELVRKSRDEYCTKSHSSLRITPSKNLFHWCSQSKGGRGALDYLLTVEGMSFRSAVMLLNEMKLVPFQQARAATVESSRTHDFTLPRPDKNCEAVAAYLMHRGISPKVLRYCLNEGILYRPRAAATATAFLWARMKAAFRVLLFSVAVRERTAVMSPAAKRSTDF